MSSIKTEDSVNDKVQFTFYHLPTEIQITIFKLLNFQSFLACRRVSHDWKDVVDSIQDNATWLNFITESLPKYLVFVQKSKLPIYKVLKNMASMEMQKTVTIKEITTSNVIQKIHIYKGSFIAVCIDSVKYYDADTFLETRCIQRKCHDYNESDHMQVEISPDSTLKVYGKINKYSFPEDIKCPEFDDISVTYKHKLYLYLPYKLCYDKFYFISKGQYLWKLQWCKNAWLRTFVARLYDSDVICDINIWGEELCIITKCGKLYGVVGNTGQLMLWSRFDIHSHSLTYRLFDKCSLMSHTKGAEVKLLEYDNSEGIFLAAPGTSVMLEHGDLLVLGGWNRLELSSIMSLKSTLTYDPLVLRWESEAGEVVAVDVYEAECARFLYVLTNSSKIIQFSIS